MNTSSRPMGPARHPCTGCWWAVRIAGLWLCLTLPWALAAAPAARSFDTPEDAVAALADALRSNRADVLAAVLGAGGSQLVDSGDPVEDAQGRQSFLAAYDEAHQIVVQGGDARQAELQIGRSAWPWPIPLARGHDGRWHFNTAAGRAEILARRMGQNELAAIQVCLAIVDAERDYAFRHAGPDGLGEYARRFRSRPGQHDGLYWPSPDGGDQSPLGPLLMAAASEGYADARPGGRVPYHGYFYKLLTAQGPGAPDGARNYLVGGRLVGGIAVMAYPARYGASGVKSFMANHNRIVYEKDLGPHSDDKARATRQFNPTPSWQEVAHP